MLKEAARDSVGEGAAPRRPEGPGAPPLPGDNREDSETRLHAVHPPGPAGARPWDPPAAGGAVREEVVAHPGRSSQPEGKAGPSGSSSLTPRSLPRPWAALGAGILSCQGPQTCHEQESSLEPEFPTHLACVSARPQPEASAPALEDCMWERHGWRLPRLKGHTEPQRLRVSGPGRP